MRRTVAVLLLSGLASTPWLPALAEDRTPPRVVLLSEGDRQRGDLGGTSTWSNSSGENGCVTGHGDSFSSPTFPRRSADVDRGKTPFTMRIVRDERPRKLRVRSWRHVDAEDHAVGPSRDVRAELRPGMRDGRVVAWLVEATARLREDLYLLLNVSWRDEDGCGIQNAHWTFHLSAGENVS